MMLLCIPFTCSVSKLLQLGSPPCLMSLCPTHAPAGFLSAKLPVCIEGALFIADKGIAQESAWWGEPWGAWAEAVLNQISSHHVDWDHCRKAYPDGFEKEKPPRIWQTFFSVRSIPYSHLQRARERPFKTTLHYTSSHWLTSPDDCIVTPTLAIENWKFTLVLLFLMQLRLKMGKLINTPWGLGIALPYKVFCSCHQGLTSSQPYLQLAQSTTTIAVSHL